MFLTTRSWLLLLRTVRHLTLRQMLFQCWYRVRKPALAPIEAPSIRTLAPWIDPIGKRASLQLPATFTFLNETCSYTGVPAWNDLDTELLWRYNLHYFDYVNVYSGVTAGHTDQTAVQNYNEHCTRIIEQWVSAHASLSAPAWDPYPTSLRIVNWIRFHHTIQPLDDSTLDSLATQVEWLNRNIEYHILANHLFANAKALVIAGIFFDGQDARRWLKKGLRLVNAQLQEQILADGAHFERSPMYHAIMLEDVLDLVNIARSAGSTVLARDIQGWIDTAANMMRWQEGVQHPDGGISFFNDAAFDIAATGEEIVHYAQRLGVAEPVNNPVPSAIQVMTSGEDQRNMPVPASGMVRMESACVTLICDVAPVGPEYQPGHAHADTLSFEMSWGRDRVFVNSGTSTYLKGALRHWQRSTAAHNTVEVDGRNSSEVWAGFRVARRAYPQDIRLDRSNGRLALSAAHNGYSRSGSRCLHRRTWSLDSASLQIRDELLPSAVQSVARFYLHPLVQVTGVNQLMTPSGRYLNWQVSGGRASLESSAWYPRFGVQKASQCLLVEWDAGSGKPLKLEIREA